mgnify:CR=1 FL=1
MSEVIERLKMPIEERWRNTCMGLWTTWVNLSRYYAEEFGWKKANERIRGITDKEGASDAQYALKRNNIEERDATAVLRAGMDFIVNSNPDTNPKILEYTPRRSVVEWYKCSQCDVARDMGIADKYDMPGLCQSWWSRVAKTVDPKLNAKLEKLICKGDDLCNVAIWKE